ncbi:DNA polymerase III subunit delta [Clostridium sp. SYSU_GA19001]|uniref:DNA polymerase III subunit delta n=1 Tax=Clostridium caldaquaticum TaxID=2940653 RepID=UPI0020775F46|nr:DNA polymerase III subunit delta [Clostridium caldaquaticum]MCM8710394.1 DNA polymerase III subunit delta [Clostridium caldaquaticum]
MLDYLELEDKIKKNKFDNCYIFCGIDEALMKGSIKSIVDKNLEKTFKDLNYIQFDGLNVDMENVINTCETIPFMSDKKVVVVYRSTFLGEGEDKEFNKRFEKLTRYLDNPASHCILILYHVFENDREKPSDKIKKLEKKSVVVKFEKLKGAALERKVKILFEAKGKNIGKIELRFFCDGLENNMNIIQNEIEKLCSYTCEREITKEDILRLLPPKADNDIFNLVDNVSQKKVEKALEILNELIFKGEKIPYILYMIERQFNILLQIKFGLEEGKDKNALSKELHLNPFICDKMIVQSRKFSTKGLKNAIDLCLKAEEVLKSSSINGKTEMELLILNTITA